VGDYIRNLPTKYKNTKSASKKKIENFLADTFKSINNNKTATMTYNAHDILLGCIDVWREEQIKYNSQFSTYDTLDKLKYLCEYHNIEDKNILKDVFDECEHPFIYDIENDEITNSEEDDESEEEEEELPPAQ